MLPPNNHPLDCTYNRDDVVSGLTQYYLNLTRLAYIPSSYIDFPPSTGWTDAELDVGALRALRRSEKVIDLLRHLPYPRPMLDGPRPGPWNIAPRAKAVRYLRHMGDFSRWSDRGDAGLLELAALAFADTPAGPMDLPPDVVSLTYGERIQPGIKYKPYWWIVDCSRGILSPYQEWTYTVGQVPRNKPWRTVQSCSVADFFRELVSDLGRNLIPLPPTEDLDAEILDSSSSADRMDALQIYQSYGWPNHFRHEDCIVALQAWRGRLLEEERVEQDEDEADDEDYNMSESDDDDGMDQDGVDAGLADAVADMEVDDLNADLAVLRADMRPEVRAKFEQTGNKPPVEWIDSE
ncbi:hypothetical protein CCHL11_03112 [Colletotrichum chlorophyti]|uniref:Alpha beta hydrolase fold protein n=1 Tax=Colletotrichum chlorophyti TaxID=708187 RepID=A0A1Q8RGW6_9PEZI|nr:hypothetical protein CCHL11_03112 [Colletotrichum chlorophyti]